MTIWFLLQLTEYMLTTLALATNYVISMSPFKQRAFLFHANSLFINSFVSYYHGNSLVFATVPVGG